MAKVKFDRKTHGVKALRQIGVPVQKAKGSAFTEKELDSLEPEFVDRLVAGGYATLTVAGEDLAQTDDEPAAEAGASTAADPSKPGKKG